MNDASDPLLLATVTVVVSVITEDTPIELFPGALRDVNCPILSSGCPELLVVVGSGISPVTATSQVSPAGTSMMWIAVPLLLLVLPSAGNDSTSPPPSLPMISLVIANLNPRDLM